MPTSTTPRSSSPAKGPSTEEHGNGDASMMVEPPTEFMDEELLEQLEQSESDHPQEETTVRLFPQSFQPRSSSQPPPQIVKPDKNLDAPMGNAQGRRYQSQTPDLQKRLNQKEVQPSPSSPGRLVPFDWDEFEVRYQKALDEADEQEKELLEEFDHLVKYFNAWASASSAHDNERAIKRLQTRERHVRISEQALGQRKKHQLSKLLKFLRQADIDSFHDAHFSKAALGLFETQFLTFANTSSDEQTYDEYDHEYDGYEEEEEDDGLGYYPDGVKRTLTDEQIAIFRHSEIETLRRVQEKTGNKNTVDLGHDTLEAAQAADRKNAVDEGEEEEGELQDGSEDGELESEKPTAAELKRMKRKRAKQVKREKRKFIPEPKEDLRKRTWDKVESGMDSLDYDGLETAQNTASNHAAQRRRISYED